MPERPSTLKSRMTTPRPDIPIVVPRFNKQSNLPLFIENLGRLAQGMCTRKQLAFEVALMSDGSSDDALHVIRDQRKPQNHLLSN